MDLTHASFFSGVGGLDLGLERAGWRTVSFSEIDPYASAVLAERWPGVPNLGDIVGLADRLSTNEPGRRDDAGSDWRPTRNGSRGVRGSSFHGEPTRAGSVPWQSATLWTGGFPCQDLSIAGKRRGLDGARSGLAFAYLGLVERHRPPWVLLENVPGLLSSNRGRDLAVLLGRLAELGYGVAYRVLDARYFGVAQRRRRVFILASRDPGGRAGADRAAAVLSVAAGGGGHPAAGGQEGPGASGVLDDGADIALWQGHGSNVGPFGTVRAGNGNSGGGVPFLVARPPDDAGGQGRRGQGAAPVRERQPDAGYQPDADAVRRAIRPSIDSVRDRKTDGLAGRLDDRQRVAATLNSGGNKGGFRTEPGEHLVVYRKATKAHGPDDWERWERDDLSDTLSLHGTTSATAVVGTLREHVRPGSNTDHSLVGTFDVADDPLLPLGLDSHRYRCCGNGVVSNVAQAIGEALAAEIAAEAAA